jgi:hypothetical protein
VSHTPEHQLPITRCIVCHRRMPDLGFTTCYSCTHPRLPGETTQAYRKRVYAETLKASHR